MLLNSRHAWFSTVSSQTPSGHGQCPCRVEAANARPRTAAQGLRPGEELSSSGSPAGCSIAVTIFTALGRALQVSRRAEEAQAATEVTGREGAREVPAQPKNPGSSGASSGWPCAEPAVRRLPWPRTLRLWRQWTGPGHC